MELSTSFGTIDIRASTGYSEGYELWLVKKRDGNCSSAPLAAVEDTPDRERYGHNTLRVRIWPQGGQGIPDDHILGRMSLRRESAFASREPLTSYPLLAIRKGKSIPLAAQYSAGTDAHMTLPTFYHDTDDYTLQLLQADRDMHSERWRCMYNFIPKDGGTPQYIWSEFSSALGQDGAIGASFYQFNKVPPALAGRNPGLLRLKTELGPVLLGEHISARNGLTYFAPHDWRTAATGRELDTLRPELLHMELTTSKIIVGYQMLDAQGAPIDLAVHLDPNHKVSHSVLGLEQRIAPFTVTHQEDRVSLNLHFPGDYKARELRAYDLDGSGHCWEDVARSFARRYMPGVLHHLVFDSENDMFSVYSKTPKKLEQFALAFHKACEDPELLDAFLQDQDEEQCPDMEL